MKEVVIKQINSLNWNSYSQQTKDSRVLEKIGIYK